MNERIKQLAQEAGMYVDLNGKPWPKWMGAEECEVAYKKFSELIIEDIKYKLYLNGYDDAVTCIDNEYRVNKWQ
jgi:NADPH-dependent 7-cyano-7-deazaguanine reductase QueF-like protein